MNGVLRLSRRYLANLPAESVSNICTRVRGVALTVEMIGYSTFSEVLKTTAFTAKYASTFLDARRVRIRTMGIYNPRTKKIFIRDLIRGMHEFLKILTKIIPIRNLVHKITKSLMIFNIILEFIEVSINHERFSRGGFTRANILKMVAALAHPVIARFLLFYVGMNYGVYPVFGISAIMIKFREWIDSQGMDRLSDFLVSVEVAFDDLVLGLKEVPEANKIYLQMVGMDMAVATAA